MVSYTSSPILTSGVRQWEQNTLFGIYVSRCAKDRTMGAHYPPPDYKLSSTTLTFIERVDEAIILLGVYSMQGAIARKFIYYYKVWQPKYT